MVLVLTKVKMNVIGILCIMFYGDFILIRDCLKIGEHSGQILTIKYSPFLKVVFLDHLVCPELNEPCMATLYSIHIFRVFLEHWQLFIHI